MRLRSKGAGQIGNRKFTHLSEHPEENGWQHMYFISVTKT